MVRRKTLNKPLVSIIVPFYKQGLRAGDLKKSLQESGNYRQKPYLLEAIDECLALDYPHIEILVGIDRRMSLSFRDKRIRVLKTDKLRTGPAEKRDIGIVKAKGKYIAFLDDDSYPAPDWLKKAVRILEADAKLNAVCGPGLTPPADGFFQKITGAILASPFGSGPYSYRFIKGKPRFVDDYPAYNLIVKRETLIRVGGFGTKFYGGEDTALCIKLINAGERIFYHPDIVVYHHRRRFPFEYVKQVGNVGLHRGYFVKAYPQTSLRPSYFGPAAVTVGLPVLILWSFYNSQIALWLLVGIGLAYTAIFVEGLKRNSLVMSLVLPFAVLVNHLAYGTQFLKGLLFTKELVR